MKKFLKNFLINIPKLLDKEEINILDNEIHKHFLGKQSANFEHQHRGYWERQVDFWGSNVPPVRPSEEDINVYKNFLRQANQKNNILILGSTPELRDLVSEETSAKIYVADFSYRMPVAMLKFTKNVDPLKETWVKGSWLDLPFPSKFFDVILGDVALHQLTPELEPVFLEKMKSFLKDDGFFITRIFFLDEKFLKNDLRDITKKILIGPFTYQQKSSLLRLQTVWLFSDLAKRKFNRRLSAEKFGELLKEFPDKIMKEAHSILVADRDSYRHWSPPEEKDLIRMISQYFSVKDRRMANDYSYAEYFPIFLLAPKSGVDNER